MENQADLRGAFDAIDAARARAGISQAELARGAGISESTYNRLVRVTGRAPYRRTIVRLKEALARLGGDA